MTAPDHTINFSTLIGEKYVRVVWDADKSAPETTSEVIEGGKPDSAVNLDVMAGARRVLVIWPAGKWEPEKFVYCDYQEQEAHAKSWIDGKWHTGDVRLDGI